MKVNADYMEMNDDLLITFLLDEATADQVIKVEKWLEQDISNRRRLEQFRKIWETSKTMQFSEPIDAQASLQLLKQKIANRKDVVKMPRSLPMLKIAASFLLICGGAWFYLNHVTNKQLEFATVGVVKTDTLSDGSIITLNKHSELKYPRSFTGSQRQVFLKEGEAFFKITPDKAKPFIINSAGTTIKVIGTSFNVKSRNGKVEVIVETGIVQVNRNNSTVILKPGERVSVTENPIMLKEPNTDQLYTYYRNNEFIADNTPLWRVVQVLNEAYDSQIVIGRKELNNQLLNTTFKNESLKDILQVISRTFKITIETKGKQIILK